jgi:hypothetical protein
VRKLASVAVLTVVGIALIASLYLLRRHLPYSVGGRFEMNPEVLLHLEGIEIVGRSNGSKAWSATADSAELTQGGTSVTFTNVRDAAIYDHNNPALRLSAGKAVFRFAFGDIDASGGLTVSSEKGFTVKTNAARWSGYFKRLMCPDRVVFTFGDSRLEGNNLTADISRGEITLDNGVLIIALDDKGMHSGEIALPPAIP